MAQLYLFHVTFISANENIVVPHCKLHNDASCDISQTGTLLATFVPSHHGFPDDNILAVYSLVPSSRGQCLYTKKFGMFSGLYADFQNKGYFRRGRGGGANLSKIPILRPKLGVQSGEKL